MTKLFIIILMAAVVLGAEDKKTLNLDSDKALELVKNLGADHFKIRKKAKKELVGMGFRVLPLLKKELKKAKDPEISESLKEIITKLSHRLNIEQLTDLEKKLAEMTFKTISTGDTAKARVYPREGCMILDINTTRIVFEQGLKDLTYEHDFEIKLTGDHGGGSSSSNNLTIYKYSYSNGIGEWTVCGQSFTVENGKINIFEKKIDPKIDYKQIIFVDKKGKVKGILDIKE